MVDDARTTADPAPDAQAPVSRPKDLYRLLVHSVQDYAIFALDARGRIISWNPGAQRLKGYRQHEIIGRHFSAFYSDADVARGKPAQELLIAAEYGRFEDEDWRIRQDGSRFWANVIISAIRDPETNELLGFSKVTRDLSERRQHEEALRQSEERFRLLVEGASDYAIFLMDPQGFIQSWNAGAQRLIGYRATEIVGDNFRRFYTPEDLDAKKPERELEVAAREGRYEDEGWRIRKGGTRFWANVSVTALRDPRDNRLLGFSKITRDLSERRRSEETLRRAYRDMEAFSFTVSHDLRAPLRAMLTLSEFTLRDHAAALPEDAQRNLQSIHQSSQRASELVEALLEMARATQGNITTQPVDLAPYIREAAERARHRHGHDAKLQGADAPLMVKGDPALMSNLVENLVDNAWKYTRETSSPIVRVALVPTEQVGYGIFSVGDNGVGFEPGRARDLFQPFRRLHGKEYPGTGVGLATVRRIAERHGGRAWADAKLGEGATISVELPTP